MNIALPSVQLSRAQLLLRAGGLAATILSALALRSVDPVSLSWLPLRTSCGAVTGMPCIFCGTTRALHHLLLGEFTQALYFNWLAFVVAATGLAMAAIIGAELFLRRRWLLVPTVRLTPRLAGIVAAALVGLWTLQATLAVSQHKRELLNPEGLLYALFVKSL